MQMETKKIIALILALLLTAALFTACADKDTVDVKPTETISGSEPQQTSAPVQTASPEQSAEPEPVESTGTPSAQTVIFTDSTGRDVEVPQNITKIAVTGPLAQIVLFSVAPDKMVGIATEWDQSAAEYFDEKYYNLPVLGQLYGGKGELNLEELLLADPDIVIDVGETKGNVGEDLTALQEQTGIPFVHIAAYTASMKETYRMLGELLGLEEKAEALGAFCEEVYSIGLEVSRQVADENKTTLLYCLGDQGLNVIAKGSFHAEIIDMLALNAAVVDEPSSKGTGNETDMEQLLLWDPEIILFAPDSVYDNVGSDPNWQQLSAIRNGKYYRVPFGPYNWLMSPPSVQRFLGILWLADLLYPDVTDYDLFTEVKEYYSLFYHCDLTQAQFEALTENSR